MMAEEDRRSLQELIRDLYSRLEQLGSCCDFSREELDRIAEALRDCEYIE